MDDWQWRHMPAYEEGFLASDGTLRKDSPYRDRKGDPRYQAWDAGWVAGDAYGRQPAGGGDGGS